MSWVYWLVGSLWIADGFMFFVFPSSTRRLLMRVYREARIVLVGAGPAIASVLLWGASFSAGRPWALRALAVVSLGQALYLMGAVKTTSPRLIEGLVALPDRYYRLWGLLWTILGPLLIGSAP